MGRGSRDRTNNFEEEAELNRLNNLIEKYETSLRIAGDDIVKTDERCNVCPSIYFCKRKSMTDLACKRTFIADWKEKAGIE